MSHWIELYLDMVKLLLIVIKFQRIGNWDGFLLAFSPKFIPFCFALNKHNYAFQPFTVLAISSHSEV